MRRSWGSCASASSRPPIVEAVLGWAKGQDDAAIEGEVAPAVELGARARGTGPDGGLARRCSALRGRGRAWIRRVCEIAAGAGMGSPSSSCPGGRSPRSRRRGRSSTGPACRTEGSSSTPGTGTAAAAARLRDPRPHPGGSHPRPCAEDAASSSDAAPRATANLIASRSRRRLCRRGGDRSSRLFDALERIDAAPLDRAGGVQPRARGSRTRDNGGARRGRLQTVLAGRLESPSDTIGGRPTRCAVGRWCAPQYNIGMTSTRVVLRGSSSAGRSAIDAARSRCESHGREIIGPTSRPSWSRSDGERTSVPQGGRRPLAQRPGSVLREPPPARQPRRSRRPSSHGSWRSAPEPPQAFGGTSSSSTIREPKPRGAGGFRHPIPHPGGTARYAHAQQVRRDLTHSRSPGGPSCRVRLPNSGQTGLAVPRSSHGAHYLVNEEG
jgi:hypothetical protein